MDSLISTIDDFREDFESFCRRVNEKSALNSLLSSRVMRPEVLHLSCGRLSRDFPLQFLLFCSRQFYLRLAKTISCQVVQEYSR